MKKSKLLTVAIITAIMLTGCTSAKKYEKAINLMDEGKLSEAVQIYEKLNDEDKVRFKEIVEEDIQEDINNFNYNEIDIFYNVMNDDLKEEIKNSAKADFESKINNLTMESNHDKIMDIIEKMNVEIKDLSQKDDEYLDNNNILTGVEESLDEIYEGKEIKKYEEAVRKLGKISANYAKLGKVEEVKQGLTQRKNEIEQELFDGIVADGKKYLEGNDFENAMKQLKRVRNIVPNKKVEADKLTKEWKEKEREYVKEQQKIMITKMEMVAQHEESGTKTYHAKGAPMGVFVEEFYFEVNVNIIKEVSEGMFLTVNCPNELPIYVKGIEFLADGEKCEFLKFNYDYETEEYDLTWAERISKIFLREELDELRRFGTAKEAKIIVKGKDGNLTFVIPKAEKQRLVTSIDFHKIFQKEFN